MMNVHLLLAAFQLIACAGAAFAQLPGRQTQADDYTRYELLAPDTAQFRILYEVTATTPGATGRCSSACSSRFAGPASRPTRGGRPSPPGSRS